MASNLVEGNWGEKYIFRMLTPQDFDQLSEHLAQNFVPDEPAFKLTGATDETAKEFSQIFESTLSENLTFAAFDKDSGKMAAVRIISRHKKGDHDDDTLAPASFKSPAMQTVAHFLNQVDAGVDIFNFYGVDEYADLRVASVGREFRRQGLATEMYKRALTLVKNSGLKVAKSIFTNPHTRAAASKLGFVELCRRPFREMEDLSGALVCPSRTGEDEFGSVMAIKI